MLRLMVLLFFFAFFAYGQEGGICSLLGRKDEESKKILSRILLDRARADKFFGSCVFSKTEGEIDSVVILRLDATYKVVELALSLVGREYSDEEKKELEEIWRNSFMSNSPLLRKECEIEREGVRNPSRCWAAPSCLALKRALEKGIDETGGLRKNTRTFVVGCKTE